MIVSWIFYGSLDDPFNEFFVSCDLSVNLDNLWQKKYFLRKNILLPNFINNQQANQVNQIATLLSQDINNTTI